MAGQGLGDPAARGPHLLFLAGQQAQQPLLGPDRTCPDAFDASSRLPGIHGLPHLPRLTARLQYVHLPTASARTRKATPFRLVSPRRRDALPISFFTSWHQRRIAFYSVDTLALVYATPVAICFPRARAPCATAHPDRCRVGCMSTNASHASHPILLASYMHVYLYASASPSDAHLRDAAHTRPAPFMHCCAHGIDRHRALTS